VTFVARVGNDMFGEQAVAGLVENGVNVQHVEHDGCPSGVALIFVGGDGENSIGVASGANGKLSPADVCKAKDAFADADVVMMQLETPLDAVQAAADLAKELGKLLILNPAPAQPLSDKLLKKVSIITPNESEAELLTGVCVSDDASCERAAAMLLERGVQTVIITLGAQGAFVATKHACERVAGFQANAVDTTAAGDVFNGSLAVALAEGKPLAEAVRFANAAAAISVTRIGAQPSGRTRQEIETMAGGKKAPERDGHEPRLDGLHMHDRLRAKPAATRSTL
jgi:ribokinase